MPILSLDDRQKSPFDFVERTCNYELATDVIIAKNMTLDDITNAIVKRISNKSIHHP